MHSVWAKPFIFFWVLGVCLGVVFSACLLERLLWMVATLRLRQCLQIEETDWLTSGRHLPVEPFAHARDVPMAAFTNGQVPRPSQSMLLLLFCFASFLYSRSQQHQATAIFCFSRNSSLH